MKLYLSSYRLGDNSDTLSRMIKGSRRVAVIRNALDFSSDRARLDISRDREFADLRSLDLEPVDLDLRDYFARPLQLRAQLCSVDAVWVVGGNAFILRRAMSETGLDHLLMSGSLGPEFVYAGYSAGACVASLTLQGIENVDRPDVVPDGYPVGPIWDGLGLVHFAIAPHYRSNHPDTEEIEKSVAYFIDHEIPFIKLRDGEAYVGETSGCV